MASKKNGRRDLSLFGISDTELLAIIDDLADENGWTSAYNVRLQLGENPEQEGRSGVGPRMGWMRRFGWLERNIDTGDYRLSAMGHLILENPRMNKTLSNALEHLNPAQRIEILRRIGEHGYSSTDEVRTAYRRQWKRSIGRYP